MFRLSSIKDFHSPFLILVDNSTPHGYRQGLMPGFGGLSLTDAFADCDANTLNLYTTMQEENAFRKCIRKNQIKMIKLLEKLSRNAYGHRRIG